MLILVVGYGDDRFHINVLCFVKAPNCCGAYFFMPGALPLNTPRPLRLSDFFAKVPARPGV